jgi:hypothetical protein
MMMQDKIAGQFFDYEYLSNPVDFIIVSFKNTDYVKLALESLEHFINHPHTVTIVDNGSDIDRYKKIYRNKNNYQILEGPQKGIWSKPGDGSRNHSAGLALGMKNTSNPIVCFLDCDILFLDTWTFEILPLLEDNFLVSNRFDRNICREMFMIFKREKFEKYDLYPDATHIDSCGNITKMAAKQGESCVILENTAFSMDGVYIGDKSNHVIDVPYGEQCSIYDKPIFFHYGRGETRSEEDQQKFVNEGRRYLDEYDSTI